MRAPLRVALMGAHGTGKTTLLQAVLGHLHSLQVRAIGLPEAPREIIRLAADAEFFRRGHNTAYRQALILIVHLIQELSALPEEAVVISDRALLDHWAYSRYLFSEELTRDGVLQLYEDFVIRHCSTYDILFFLPIEFNVADDGTREGDSRFQHEIEAYLLDLIRKSNLPVTPLRGSVEERRNQCVEAILAKLSLSAAPSREVSHA